MTAHDESTKSSAWIRPATVAFLVAMAVLGAVAPLARPFSPDPASAPEPAQLEEVPAPAFGS